MLYVRQRSSCYLHVVEAVEGLVADCAGELGGADEDLGGGGDPVLAGHLVPDPARRGGRGRRDRRGVGVAPAAGSQIGTARRRRGDGERHAHVRVLLVEQEAAVAAAAASADRCRRLARWPPRTPPPPRLPLLLARPSLPRRPSSHPPRSPRLGGSRRCPPKAICRAGRAGRSRAGRTRPSRRSPLVAPRPRPSPSRRHPLVALHRPPTGRLPNPTEPLRPTMALPRPTLRGTAPLHQPTAPRHRCLLPGRCLRRHR